tara:strand:+ start:1207 stop:1386 length:180 start_codon:yes stop_codon:yes gene_type:complete
MIKQNQVTATRACNLHHIQALNYSEEATVKNIFQITANHTDMKNEIMNESLIKIHPVIK